MAPTRPRLASVDIESIIDEVETPETSVTLCLKGSLVAEYERLDAQLADAAREATSLAGVSPAAELTAQMGQLREQMKAHERDFRFRAVTPRGDWRRLTGARPVKTEQQTDDEYADLYHAWVCGIVAASAIDPVMTAEQAERLADKLSDGQWSKLANAAWAVNEDDRGIPFSAAASVLSRSSGEKSKQPEPSDSPEADSSAGSLAGPPSTSETPTGE